MKKIVSFILVLAMVCITSAPVSATGPDVAFGIILTQTIVEDSKTTEAANVLFQGNYYTVTREIYFPDEEKSYTLVEVLGEDVVTTLDSRNNYAVENGVQIPVTVKNNLSERASKPNTIDHNLLVASGWTYSYSTWASVTTAGPIASNTPSLLLGAFSLAATGNLAFSLGIMSPVITFFQNDPYRQYDHTCLLRTYTYAYVNVLSHFGSINQVYTSDYVPIENSAAKAYTGPFAF